MATCVGCGEPLAPAWKYCIHCGIAVEAHRSGGSTRSAATSARRARAAPALIIGGVGVFLVGIALLVVAIAFLSGSFG